MAQSNSYDFTVTRDNLADIGWLAGIVDGEGCIYVDKYGIRVRIGSADPFMAFECKKIYSRGIIQESKREDDYYVYYWIISTCQARDFLEIIVPYLRVKKDQALKAIEFQKVRDRCGPKNRKYWNPEDRILQKVLISEIKNLKKLNRGVRRGTEQ